MSMNVQLSWKQRNLYLDNKYQVSTPCLKKVEQFYCHDKFGESGPIS